MTVSTELSHEEYVGNGVTTDFDFRFRIFEGKHLIVVVADSDGNETTLKNGTDYTIVGAGSYHGGKVVLNKPLAQGWKILLERDLPVVQETDLRNQGKFFAEVHEDAFDYLTMLIQKALGTFSLSLRKPTYLSNYYDAKGNRIANLAPPKLGTDAVNKDYVDNGIKDIDSKTLRVKDKPINALPNTEQRANKILAFDNNGQPITVLPESGSASDVLIELKKDDGYKLVGGMHNLINPYNLRIENINKTPLDSAIELQNKPKNILRFATNNLWTHYSAETWFNGDLTSPRKAMLLKKLWLMVSADVWGFQEVFTNPVKDISMFLIPPYNNAFFTETISPIENLGFSYGVGCMTRINCIHSGGVYLSPPSDLDSEVRGFNVLFLDNDILFINTHLSTDPSRSKQMIIELADLVTSFSKNKVVIVGDFNTRNIDDFKPLENIGFEIVNKDTWLDIDKILIRNLNIVNTGMIDIIGSSAWNHLSDHNLYFVDVEV